MTNVKLSQIAPSPSNVAATTQFVAVEGGNTDYLFSPSQFINGFGLLRSTVADQTLSGGWNVTAHTYATGSITVDCGQGPLQIVSNAGAFTITAPGQDGNTVLQVTNTSSAGPITFSGFTVSGNTGDPLTTASGSQFLIAIWRVNGISSYFVYANQAGAGAITLNVMNFGATGNGVTNDRPAIQIAINTAAAFGQVVSGVTYKSGIVYFPAGVYSIDQALVNNNASTHVRLIGASQWSSRIIGNFQGFLIDTTFTNFVSGPTNNQFQSVENLYLTQQFNSGSTGFDLTTGCIRLQNLCQAFVAQNVQMSLTTGTGVVAWQTMFEITFTNCTVQGSDSRYFNVQATAPYLNGPVGFYVTNGAFTECTSNGVAIGMWMSGPMTMFLRCRVETSGIGMVVGGSIPGAPPTGGTFGSSNSSGTNNVIGFQTERCDVGMFVLGMTSATVEQCSFTGIIGTHKYMSNAVYNSPSAGQVLVTISSGFSLAKFGWTSGTRRILIEGIISSNNTGGAATAGFNTNGVPVTATWQSDTTFSYTPIAGDPGAYQSGANGFDWSFAIAYALRVKGTNGSTTFKSISCSVQNATANIDLYVDGSVAAATGGTCTFISVIGGITAQGTPNWIMPPPQVKSSFQFIGCDQPTGSDIDLNTSVAFPSGQTAGMLFNNLTGGSSPFSTAFPPQEGMQFDIIDAPFGLTSQGASFTGVLTSGTLGVTALTGIIAVGDQLLGSGTSTNITAGTTIRREVTPDTTYMTSGTQSVASEVMTTRYSNFGKILTAGGSSNHCRVRCSSQPLNTLATVSDGTNYAVFTALIGVKGFVASVVSNSLNLTVITLPVNAVISFGDTVTGAGIQASTTIAGVPGGGGIGVYTLSAVATSTTTSTYNTFSNVLNVTSIIAGSINSGASWTCDLLYPTSSAQTSRTITGVGPAPLPGSGGVGTYQLSGLQLNNQIGNPGTGQPNLLGLTMAAGLPGRVLTLHGTTTGTFAVGNVFRTDFSNLYAIISSAGGSQWNLTGSSLFQGAQPINASLWTVCG